MSAPEWASTENISERGARILTTQPWKPDDLLLIQCIDGTLESRARIIYRQRLHDDLFVIGIKLLTPRGWWQEGCGGLRNNALAIAN
jgi:hypothetical protein